MKISINSLLLSVILCALGGQLGHAQTVVFSDTFNTAGNANDYGWYYRGTNQLTGSNTVTGGNMLLSNNGTAMGGSSAVWKSFNSTTLASGQTLRLTLNVSGYTAFSDGVFGPSIVLGNSSTAVSADGGYIVSSDLPRYAYRISLPRGATTGGTGGTGDGATGITQMYTMNGTTPSNASQQLSTNLFSANAAADANNQTLAVTSTAQTFFTLGTYTQDAVLVWDISNVGGQITFGGSFTAPNGGATTTFLSADAGLVDNVTFNKIAIGNLLWGGTSFKVNSVDLQVVPEPTTWALIAAGMTFITVMRRRRLR